MLAAVLSEPGGKPTVREFDEPGAIEGAVPDRCDDRAAHRRCRRGRPRPPRPGQRSAGPRRRRGSPSARRSRRADRRRRVRHPASHDARVLARVLFTYLAVARALPARREELIEALWPERAPAGAEASLSALLSRLRSVVGGDVLSGRSEIRLRLPPDSWVDLEAAEEAIHRAESAVAQGDWPRGWGPSLIALFTARRGFLPGEDLPWADEHRRRLEEIRCSALECYAAVALGVGGSELAPGERVARELVPGAPFRERAHSLLMEILAARGNAAEALRVYDTLRIRLRDELGATPDPSCERSNSSSSVAELTRWPWFLSRFG